MFVYSVGRHFIIRHAAAGWRTDMRKERQHDGGEAAAFCLNCKEAKGHGELTFRNVGVLRLSEQIENVFL